jgi:hypothetical protein
MAPPSGVHLGANAIRRSPKVITSGDVADPLDVAGANRDGVNVQEISNICREINVDGRTGRVIVVDEDRLALGHRQWKSNIYAKVRRSGCDLNSLCWW